MLLAGCTVGPSPLATDDIAEIDTELPIAGRLALIDGCVYLRTDDSGDLVLVAPRDATWDGGAVEYRDTRFAIDGPLVVVGGLGDPGVRPPGATIPATCDFTDGFARGTLTVSD